jgi:hypothetical protein
MAMGAEPTEYAAPMAIACTGVAVLANSDGVSQPSLEWGLWWL